MSNMYITGSGFITAGLISKGFYPILELDDNNRVVFNFLKSPNLNNAIREVKDTIGVIEYTQQDKKKINDLINDFKRENGISVDGDWK